MRHALRVWRNLALVARRLEWMPDSAWLYRSWQQAYCFAKQAAWRKEAARWKASAPPEPARSYGKRIRAAEPDSARPGRGLRVVTCVPWPAPLPIQVHAIRKQYPAIRG